MCKTRILVTIKRNKIRSKRNLVSNTQLMLSRWWLLSSLGKAAGKGMFYRLEIHRTGEFAE